MLDLDTRRAVLQLKSLGHGVRAIARTLRIARHSVREVLQAGTVEVPVIDRPQICTAHLDTLRALYADCKGNRVRVWEEAQKQGIAISYPALTACLRRQKVGVTVKQPAGLWGSTPSRQPSARQRRLEGAALGPRGAPLTLDWPFVRPYRGAVWDFPADG